MTSLTEAFRDIRRRKVFRGMGVYILAAWSVVQVADVISDPLGLPPWTVNALLFLSIIGFPLGIWVAWRYELTNKGLIRTLPASTINPDSADLSLKISDYAIFVGMLGVFGAVAWQGLDRIRLQSDADTVPVAALPNAHAAADNTIAVLPFSDLSPNANQAYLADGMSETVLHVLSKVEGLQVTARTSSFAFRDRSLTASQIASALGVAHLLEGSVQRSGDQIRVIATVVDARTGAEVWSENFDRGIDAVFAIQDEIARSVAAALKVNVMAAGQVLKERYRPTMEAFEQFILAKKDLDSSTQEGTASAVSRLERAIELDPDYALAYVNLARALSNKRALLMNFSPQSAQRIESLVEKALQIDPLAAEAWVMKSATQAGKKDFSGAMVSLQRALEINPNLPAAHNAYSNAMMLTGDKDKGLVAARKAAELDPESQAYQLRLADMLWIAARAEEAMATLKQVIRRHPENSRAHLHIARYLTQFGQAGEAMRYLHAARLSDPGNMRIWKSYCEQYYQLWDIERGSNCFQEYAQVNPQDLDARKWLAAINKDYAAAVRIAKQEIEANPTSWYPKLQMATYLGRLGQWQEIIDVVGSAFPQLTGESPRIDDFSVWGAKEMLLAYWRMDNHSRANVMGDAILAHIERSRKQQAGGFVAGVEDAMVHAIRGNADACFASLNQLMESGWTFYAFSLTDEPAFDSVRDDRRWGEFMDYLIRRSTSEREHFLKHRDLPIT